jgi:hypothetical protein
LNSVSQLSDPFHADSLAVLFGTVDRHQQVGDQTGKDLDQYPLGATGDQMVNLQTFFPPGKEFLDLPPELVDGRNFFSREIHPVGDDVVRDLIYSVPNHPEGLLCLSASLTQQDGAVKENETVGIDLKPFKSHELFDGVALDPTDEMAVVFSPLVKVSMVLISPVQDGSFSGIHNPAYKRTLTCLSLSQMEFLGYSLIYIEADVGFEFIRVFTVFSPIHGQGGVHQRPVDCHQLAQVAVFTGHRLLCPGVEFLEDLLKLQDASVAEGFIKGAFLMPSGGAMCSFAKSSSSMAWRSSAPD